MAMPSDDSFVPDDENQERAPNVDSYRITCIDFIKDISHDYLAWVDRYKLPEEEDKKRRTEISAIIERTNEWIAKVPQTFKAVDVVMNDGIQKMAEATAGKPSQIGVFVDKKSGYTLAKPGIIDVNVKAAGREKNKTKIGLHTKDQRFRIESTGKVFFDESNITEEEYDLLESVGEAKKKGQKIGRLAKIRGLKLSKQVKAEAKKTVSKKITKAKRIIRSSEDNVELIKKLGELKKAGIISNKEFQAKKKQLLDKI